MINRLECILKGSLKWILNEQYHHYNEWEFTCRDLYLLPIKYFLINHIPQKFSQKNDISLKLPLFSRP